MALGAVEELGEVGGMVESTLMDGMEENCCKGSRQHFYKRVGRSEIEKHVEANNSDYRMGGLEDRRPATARSKGKLPRLLCGWTGGGDHPGARGGGGGGGGVGGG